MANYGGAIGSVIGATMVFGAVNKMAKKGKKLVPIKKRKKRKHK